MSTKASNSQTGGTNKESVVSLLLNFILNLLKFEKIACIVILYLLYRDHMFSKIASKNINNIDRYLLDIGIIEKILINDNLLICVLGFIIFLLLAVILIIFLYVIPIYKKEIERLSFVRSDLMHNLQHYKPLSEHNSSLNV